MTDIDPYIPFSLKIVDTGPNLTAIFLTRITKAKAFSYLSKVSPIIDSNFKI